MSAETSFPSVVVIVGLWIIYLLISQGLEICKIRVQGKYPPPIQKSNECEHVFKITDEEKQVLKDSKSDSIAIQRSCEKCGDCLLIKLNK